MLGHSIPDNRRLPLVNSLQRSVESCYNNCAVKSLYGRFAPSLSTLHLRPTPSLSKLYYRVAGEKRHVLANKIMWNRLSKCCLKQWMSLCVYMSASISGAQMTTELVRLQAHPRNQMKNNVCRPSLVVLHQYSGYIVLSQVANCLVTCRMNLKSFLYDVRDFGVIFLWISFLDKNDGIWQLCDRI